MSIINKRIEDKIDALLIAAATHTEHLKTINGTINKHDKDLEHFKKFEYQFLGGLSIVTFLISVCGVYIYFIA